MSHRIIKTKRDVADGVAALVEACPHMREVHGRAGPPPLRRRPNGFPGLARIVVGQQLSVASASAIWERVAALVTPFDPDVLLAQTDEALRGAGLSAGKIRTLRTVSEALAAGDIDLKKLAKADDDEVRERLTALKGIGPWTADIYIMFCLGRADGWAPGDLALQLAVQDAVGLDARPTLAEMIDHAEPWRPWRSVAARMLWAYYRVVRETSSDTPL
ncbi:MAG: DNA-3-methyladenine glycosylase 2 family protein [Hyphomicrobiales bacterium]|nr:DNA-3-methyladenine glycosylase 2 family protein [Hyphomicrobiales bacterium]